MNFIQITPFMHVEDLAKALTFFNDVLGFRTLVQMADYAYVHRETAGIRLLQNHGADGAPAGNRRYCYYVDVRDVDALFAELKPQLDRLPRVMYTVRPTRPTVSANSSSSRPTAISSPSATPSIRQTPPSTSGRARARLLFPAAVPRRGTRINLSVHLTTLEATEFTCENSSSC